MKVQKFFPRFARTDRHYAPLHTAFASGCNTQKMLPTGLGSDTECVREERKRWLNMGNIAVDLTASTAVEYKKC